MQVLESHARRRAPDMRLAGTEARLFRLNAKRSAIWANLGPKDTKFSKPDIRRAGSYIRSSTNGDGTPGPYTKGPLIHGKRRMVYHQSSADYPPIKRSNAEGCAIHA
jgi:hypothetical protein